MRSLGERTSSLGWPGSCACKPRPLLRCCGTGALRRLRPVAVVSAQARNRVESSARRRGCCQARRSVSGPSRIRSQPVPGPSRQGPRRCDATVGSSWQEAFRRYAVFRRQYGKLAAGSGVQRIGQDVAAYGQHLAPLCADARVLVSDGPAKEGKERRLALANVDDGREIGHGGRRGSDEQVDEDGRGRAQDRQAGDPPAALEHCGGAVNRAHGSAAVADCAHPDTHRRSDRHRVARR